MSTRRKNGSSAILYLYQITVCLLITISVSQHPLPQVAATSKQPWPSSKSRETTCFECAAQKKRKFCNLKAGTHSKSNKWNGACCLPGDESERRCQASEQNVCSDTFDNSGPLFYAYCRHAQDPHICASDEQTTLKYAAQPEPVIVKRKGIIRSASNDQQEACHYQIYAQHFQYSSGQFHLVFKKIKDMDVYLFGGTNLTNATVTFESTKNTPVLASKVYEMDISSGSLFIMAVPHEDKLDTEIDFMYWVKGEENTPIQQFVLENMADEKSKGIFFMGVGMVVWVLAIICGAIYCFGCRKEKINKVKTQDEKDDLENKKGQQAVEMNDGSSLPQGTMVDNSRIEFLDFGDGSPREGYLKGYEQVKTNNVRDKKKKLAKQNSLQQFEEQKDFEAFQQFKDELEAINYTPEEFFRLCDVLEVQKVSVSKFEVTLRDKLQINLSIPTIQRLLSKFDEDFSNMITLEEYLNALDCYDCRSENYIPASILNNKGGRLSFKYKSLFQLVEMQRKRKINDEELYRFINTDDNDYIDIDELREALKQIGEFNEKQLFMLKNYFDKDRNGTIEKNEFMEQLWKLQFMYNEYFDKKQKKKKTRSKMPHRLQIEVQESGHHQMSGNQILENDDDDEDNEDDDVESPIVSPNKELTAKLPPVMDEYNSTTAVVPEVPPLGTQVAFQSQESSYRNFETSHSGFDSATTFLRKKNEYLLDGREPEKFKKKEQTVYRQVNDLIRDRVMTKGSHEQVKIDIMDDDEPYKDDN